MTKRKNNDHQLSLYLLFGIIFLSVAVALIGRNTGTAKTEKEDKSFIDYKFSQSGYNVRLEFLNRDLDRYYFAFTKNNCINSFSTRAEKDEAYKDKGIENKDNCWDYLKENDTYSFSAPSTSHSLEILTEEKIKELSKPTTTKENGVMLTRECKPEDREIGEVKLIGLKCTASYEYANPENKKEVVRGTAGIRTHCLYELSNGNYFGYLTNIETAGDTSDNCLILEKLGLKKIEVTPLKP